MGAHRFCRDLCLERGEPHEGTGDVPERALLLPWPRGKWRTPRWESVGMSPELSAAVLYALDNGVHLALVDRVGDSESLPGLMALPDSLAADFDSEADLVAAIRAYVDGRPLEGTRDPRTTILCCTDSRRDACCARYGFATYKALVAAVDPARFNVVQVTHIGGCRFAASLMVWPDRQRYGRMTAGQVPAFVEALSRGEIYLPAYKGRAGQPEAIQVAELAAMRWAEQHRRNAGPVRVHGADLPEEPAEGTALTLVADAGGQELHIRLRAKTFMVQGNCGIVAEGGGTEQLRWCLDDLKASLI